MNPLYQAHSHTGLLLNANECSSPLHPGILSDLFARISRASLNRYPDDAAKELTEAYAALYHLDPNGVLVGNGSDATLQMMITTFCRDGKALVTLDPDFGMYGFYAAAMPARVLALKTDWNGAFDPEELAALAKEQNAGLVLFSNPNNPTGHVCSVSRILSLARTLDPIVLAVDEAYMDFSDQSVLHLAQSLPNLIVTRTLSKAWGLAGIRIGFLIACPALAAQIRRWKIVYSVSTLDQCAALAALDHPEIHEDYVKMIRKEARRIEERLKQAGRVKTGPFEANFYSLSLGTPEKNRQLEEAFERAGISVRTWSDSGRIRITIGLPEENERVLEVLEACLESSKEEV